MSDASPPGAADAPADPKETTPAKAQEAAPADPPTSPRRSTPSRLAKDASSSKPEAAADGAKTKKTPVKKKKTPMKKYQTARSKKPTSATKKKNDESPTKKPPKEKAESDGSMKRGKKKDALMIEKLKAFRARFPEKNCNVPDKWKEDPVLANWVSQQRRSYADQKIKPERVAELNELGFAWKLQHKNWYDSFRTDFDDMMGRLTKFYNEHGHPNVPSRFPEDPRLAQWVKNQRTYRDRKTLEKSKIDRLDALGFVWRFKKRNDWDEMCERLIAFKEVNGHCNVAQAYKEDPQLGKWCQNQRAVCTIYLFCCFVWVLLLPFLTIYFSNVVIFWMDRTITRRK